jgi:uncharacterized pyridoxal phosphate-dependent enzyme
MNGIGVYERLGVRRVINAWGVATELGGWTPSEKVMQAMEEANHGTVEMQELLQKSGDFIADILGVEAAFVTSGGAAAQALSIAACMAGTDPDKISRLPDTTGMKNEVVIQKRNRYMFDRCFTLTGGKLVDAGDDDGTTEDDLNAAIGPNTTAVAYYIQPPIDDAIVSLEDTVALARSRGVTAIADACSQIYPLDYFRRCAQSADLVTFGAKYMGAPHSAGFVCGKRELVDAVSAQSFVTYHYDGGKAVGRAMKIDRHEIIGVVTAIEDWFTMDHEDRILEYEARFATITDALWDVDGATPRRIEINHYVPYMMLIDVDEAVVGKSAEQVRVELDSGNPRIWVGAEDGSLHVVVNCMSDEETAVVAERLRQVLTSR